MAEHDNFIKGNQFLKTRNMILSVDSGTALSLGYAKLFNMVKRISFQNYPSENKHVCDTEC